MQLIHEDRRSLLMHLLQIVVRPFGHYLVKAKKEYPAGSVRLPAHKKAHKKCKVVERKVEDLWIYDLTPKRPLSEVKVNKRIYYFNGGGWQQPPESEHWNMCAEMVKQLPDTVTSVVSYPLAPHSAAPVAFPHLLRWFKTAMKEASEAGETIILAGDSSGGNIVLCLTLFGLQEWKEDHCPLKSLVVVSPTCDLSHTNPEENRVEKHDPMHSVDMVDQTGKAWAGEWDRKDPRISPIYADISVLKKYDIQVYGISAGYDVLGVDARLFRDRLEKEQVEGAWLDWDKQIHCFPLAFSYGFSESKEALHWLFDKVRNMPQI